MRCRRKRFNFPGVHWGGWKGVGITKQLPAQNISSEQEMGGVERNANQTEFEGKD